MSSEHFDLWPIKFVSRQLEDIEAANQSLIELVRGLERQHRDLTTDYRSPDLFNRNDPGVNWLRDQVNQTVVDYLAHPGMDYPIDWIVQG
jgi:hypothetical protein